MYQGENKNDCGSYFVEDNEKLCHMRNGKVVW